MTKQKGIDSVVSIKPEPKDILHNVSGKDRVSSDFINGSKGEQIKPIFTIANVPSLETMLYLLHQEPIESDLNVALEVSVVTTNLSKQTDQMNLIEEQMEPMPNIAKFHPVETEDNVKIQEQTDSELNVTTPKPMESVSCEESGVTTDHSKQVDQFDYSFITPETGEITKTKGFKRHKWYRKRSYCKKYKNRIVANLANFGSKPPRPLKKTKQCPLCYKTLSKRNLAKHLKRNCDRGFLRKLMLREHDYATSKRKLLHSRASLRDLLTDNTGNVQSDKFLCSVCQKHFVSHRALVRHMRKVHIEESIYCCTYCSKSFTMKESLRQHKRIHAAKGAGTYSKDCVPLLHKTLLKCPKCHLQFKCKGTLKEHLYNPCKCSVCKLVLKCRTLTKEPEKKMVDNNKKSYASRIKIHSIITSEKHNNKHRRLYSRCLMCLCWYRGIEEHLWMCKAKRPCLRWSQGVVTDIFSESKLRLLNL